MQWSPQQDTALKSVASWLRTPATNQIFYLAGYAGTGKTTLAKHLVAGYDGNSQFCAFTGKAALVMEKAGCIGARTIHSLLYDSSQKSTKTLKELETQLASTIITVQRAGAAEDPREQAKIKKLREAVEAERERMRQPSFRVKEESPLENVDLLVVDECSMVDGQMATDLMSYGSKILVLGDPAQLPPVTGSGYFTSRVPDFTLTEIHRQAADNPIIAMATDVRNGKTLNLGAYGDSRIILKRGSEREDYYSDQILVGMNKTRTYLNTKMRAARGIETCLPVPGDKLMCLRNEKDLGLLNGSMWTAKEVVEVNADRLILTVDSMDGGAQGLDVECHTATFQGRKMEWHEKLEAQDFDHAIAVTVHKSQGSQWPTVTLMDEWTRNDYDKWLYTAITRAQERITIIR